MIKVKEEADVEKVYLEEFEVDENEEVEFFDSIGGLQKLFGEDFAEYLETIVKVNKIYKRSVFETMGRTINSTITTLITIVLIYILGVSAIKEFALPLIVGILAGAYTSIFIASTFWASWKESDMKAKAAAAQERKAAKKNK